MLRAFERALDYQNPTSGFQETIVLDEAIEKKRILKQVKIGDIATKR